MFFNYTNYKLQFIRTDFIMKKVSFKTKLCCEIYFWKSKAFCRRCVAFFVFMFNQTSSALVSRKKEVLGYIWTKIDICLLNCPNCLWIVPPTSVHDTDNQNLYLICYLCPLCKLIENSIICSRCITIHYSSITDERE